MNRILVVFTTKGCYAFFTFKNAFDEDNGNRFKNETPFEVVLGVHFLGHKPQKAFKRNGLARIGDFRIFPLACRRYLDCSFFRSECGG